MKKISQLLYSKSSLPVCLVATVLMVAYALWGMGSHTRQVSGAMLDTRFGYNAGEADAYFSSLSAEGLEEYNRMLLIWDNFFPFFYGAMNLFWLSWIWKKHRFRIPAFTMLNLLPLLGMLADWGENFFIRRMIHSFLESSPVMHTDAFCASFATQAKWGLSVVMYMLVLIGIILAIVRKIKHT